jgi:hypothetical protein
VGAFAAVGVLDLVGPQQGVVDAAHQLGDAVDRIEALVGVHLPGLVGVAGHLPAAAVDGLQPRLDLLDGLVAGQGAERRDIGLGVEQLPQPFGPQAGQRVLDVDGPPETLDVVGAVRPLDPLPARVVLPALGDLLGVSVGVVLGHRSSLLGCGRHRRVQDEPSAFSRPSNPYPVRRQETSTPDTRRVLCRNRARARDAAVQRRWMRGRGSPSGRAEEEALILRES